MIVSFPGHLHLYDNVLRVLLHSASFSPTNQLDIIVVRAKRPAILIMEELDVLTLISQFT